MQSKEEIKPEIQSELSLLTSGSIIEKKQRQILLEAVNEYIQWHKKKKFFDEPFIGWISNRDKKCAHDLQQELTSDLTRTPIEIVQKFLTLNSETDYNSLNQFILKSISKNNLLFSIELPFIASSGLSPLSRLRQFIIDLSINDPEYTYLVSKFYDREGLPQAHALFKRAVLLGSHGAKYEYERRELAWQNYDIFDLGPSKPIVEWSELGDEYFYAKNGKTKDYLKARICYDQSYPNPNAFYMLGVIYEHGLGVDANHITAQRFYQKAMLAGNELATLTLDNPSAKEKGWNKLGDDYFFGKSGKAKDRFLAQLCYKKVLEFNPTHPDAVESLKILSEYIDSPATIKTPEYYEKAILDSNIKKQQLILENIIASDELARMKFTKGRCWLHLLADLPYSPLLSTHLVEAAAKKIVQIDSNSLYARDNEGKTSFFNLAKSDPYKISDILRLGDFIGIRERETEISEFLEKIKANPLSEQHLLLVAGPPGVGKTEVTRAIVKKQGFEVLEFPSGTKEDRWVGQQENRVTELFSNAGKKDHPVCIFIDEIDNILPRPEKASVNSKQDLANTFQTELDKLKGKKIILVGTTNYLENIKPAIKSRAGTAVLFDLPDKMNRQLIIQDLLRSSVLEPNSTMIQKITDATSGWSPRQLKNFIDKVKNKQKQSNLLSDELFETCFEEVRKELESPREGHATMIAPRLTAVNAAPRAMPLSDDLLDSTNHICAFIAKPDAFTKINPKYKVHTLLYGPPGGGKTEFARIIVEKTNCPCFIVDPKNSLTELAEVFSQAKMCEKAIIFIDEFDHFASSRTAAQLIQTEMDGFNKPKNPLVIIAATNHLESIALPVLSRFGKKMEVPLPTEKQRSEFFKSTLTGMKKNAPNVFDDSLNAEINNGCINLGRETEDFSIRCMNDVLNLIIPILVERSDFPDRANKEPLMTHLSKIIATVKHSVEIENNLPLAANASRFFSNPSKRIAPSVGGPSPVLNKGN